MTVTRSESNRRYNRSPKGRAAVARAKAKYRTTAKWMLTDVRKHAKERGAT